MKKSSWWHKKRRDNNDDGRSKRKRKSQKYRIHWVAMRRENLLHKHTQTDRSVEDSYETRSDKKRG